MSAHSGPGAIYIGVETDAEGCVASASVRSNRPVGLGRLFIGRPPQEVPALARQLFSLCGFAHGAAARFAISAARGEGSTPHETFSDIVGALAEYCAESLRSAALGWPRIDGAPALVDAAAPLREALVAARAIMTAAAQGNAFVRRAELLPAAQIIAEAARALGLPEAGKGASEPQGLFAEILAEARADAFLHPSEPDALQSVDDAAVAQAIERNGDRFAAAPILPHRIVETGAFARCWLEARSETSALAARLRARLFATSETLDHLLLALSEGEAARGAHIAVTPLAEGAGIAAVETARGRLYHWVRLDRAGDVADYALLAPTEWNFHPAGPFAAALLGAPVGKGDAARLRVRRLAAVFDPCVAYQIELRERAHA